MTGKRVVLLVMEKSIPGVVRWLPAISDVLAITTVECKQLACKPLPDQSPVAKEALEIPGQCTTSKKPS